MTGSYIATTTEGDVQWLMAAGQSLGLAVAQLRHHLTRTLSPAHGTLLAEPVEDIAARTTDWYGDGEGAATSLEQLPPGPRATMTNTVWALLRDIRAEGVRLGASADADERVLGAMLEKVSHVPDVSCVRIRGDTPLLIAWAHGRAGQSIDLTQLFKPVEVPAARPAPPIPDRPTPGLQEAALAGSRPGRRQGLRSGLRLAWLLPLLILAVVGLGIVLLMGARHESSGTMSTASLPAALPAPVVLATPSEPHRPGTPPTQASLPPLPLPPPPHPDTTAATAATPASSATTTPIPAPVSPAPTAATVTPLPTATPTRPDTTVARAAPLPTATPTHPDATATPARQDTTAEAAASAPPATSSAIRSDSSAATTHSATSSDTPAPVLPTRPVASNDKPSAPDPSDSTADRRSQADATAPAASDHPPAGSPAAPPKPVQTAMLPPHESEAAATARPFTVTSVQAHDLALLQGCWTLGGSFATADVQSGAASKVRSWRTCFAPVEAGAATLAGTQTLAWADGKSCSGPVTARFLPDDKLEIADASDCLGDRTLFRMTEQCDRKDDAALLCAWTAHDRATNTDFRGEGLSLTPAH